tara:strand:+ start:2801 stop:3058 length:258 start_codon:yes stop_codon:yes gene_type:complete
MARSRGGGLRGRVGPNLLGDILSNLTFGFFTVNNCDSDDDDWFCKLSRAFSSFFMLLLIIIVFYVIYNIFLGGTSLTSGKMKNKK